MDKQEAIHRFRELFYSTIEETRYFLNEEYIQKLLHQSDITNKNKTSLDVNKIVYEEKLKQLDYRTSEFEKLMENLDL